MSTVIGLNDLAEDELISRPLPLELLLDRLKLNLIEDRPPVNITSPGPVPMNLEIGKMRIRRNECGVFEIQPLEGTVIGHPNGRSAGLLEDDDEQEHDHEHIGKRKSERDREMISLQLVMQQLKLDNDNLKKQMTTMEKTHEVNAWVKRWRSYLNPFCIEWAKGVLSFCNFFRGKLKQEGDTLKLYLQKAQDNITMLLEEKRKLLEKVRGLQVGYNNNKLQIKNEFTAFSFHLGCI